MLWNIYINFGIPSEEDVVSIEQSLEDTVEAYDFGDIVKKLEKHGNEHVVDDIRVHMIVKFAVFLEFVKEETQYANDDFKLTLEGLNKPETYFWFRFVESLENDSIIKDYSLEVIEDSQE